jgi:hypothetical protein
MALDEASKVDDSESVDAAPDPSVVADARQWLDVFRRG